MNKKIEKILAKKMYPRKCVCTFCGKKFHNYVTHGIESYASNINNTICMGRRKGDCPYCGCVDKYRWLWWVIQNKTKICDLDEVCSILHFAPERGVMERIRDANLKSRYISGDIEKGKADEIIDMTDIHYPDESFDYIIASMVMEHILDEGKALNELVRVLKTNGRALLTVPVALNLQCTQDDLLESDEDRLRYYGEEDYVRLYGMDICERWMKLIKANVSITKWCPEEEVGSEISAIMGVPSQYYVWCIEKCD